MNREIIQRLRIGSRPLRPRATGWTTRLPRMAAPPRVVLFDVYGTLMQSASGDVGVRDAADNGEAAGEALRQSGLRLTAPHAGSAAVEGLREAIRRAHRRKIRRGIAFPEVDIRRIWLSVLRALMRAGTIRGTITPAIAALVAAEYETRVNPVWPMPGMLAALKRARQRGPRLGIISNAQFFTPLLFDALCGQSLEALGFEPDLCIWSYRDGIAKPSPEMYCEARRRLEAEGIAPRQVLYIGNDRLNDIVPAHSVGFRTWLFAGDRRSLRTREDHPLVGSRREDGVLAAWRDAWSNG